MASAKEILDSKIASMLQTSTPYRAISRRLFLYDFNYVFSTNQERGFQISNAICERFKLRFSEVKVVGSAQVGYSYFSQRDFAPGDSDLDVALISHELFQIYSEDTYWMTTRYTDLSKFPRRSGVSTDRDFRDYLSAGFFRPDLMPECAKKSEWFRFFNLLSNKHSDLFKNINAGIYLSEAFFEMKNAAVVEEYRKALK